MNNEIGKQLKELCSCNGFTTKLVAYAVDETTSEVELWMHGKLNPSVDANRKLELLFSIFSDEHNQLSPSGVISSEISKINEENFSDFFNMPESIEVPEFFPYWLKAHGFFVAPASLGHHGNRSGGLYIHSKNVANELNKYTRKLGLQWNDSRSAWLVGMFHDLCKIDDYCYNWAGDKWEWNKNQLIPGHGEKSLMMLQQHLTLNEQEIACIRWHMGAFTDQKEWEYYGRAVERYPAVLFTHAADMYASRVLGV